MLIVAMQILNNDQLLLALKLQIANFVPTGIDSVVFVV